jgi:hypothetical protein
MNHNLGINKVIAAYSKVIVSYLSGGTQGKIQ